MTDTEAFLRTARQVVTDEARALDVLAEGLDEQFAEAVQLILQATGRIIISGIGKSGHIGHKIAATLASTGTPAYFVHPAEASHGDLGMVSKGDVVLAISNSGEAPELVNLLAFTRRFGIPLIGLSSKPESTLMTQADVLLLIPSMGEACGFGMVPSISTTLTLAMGDALAIALMKYRDFKPEDFRAFHPGGKLGAQLSTVRDLMHADLPLVPVGTPMSEALLVMSQKSFGVVGVTDAAGRLMGIVTDGDLRRNMDGLLNKTTEEVMTRDPLTIAPNAMAEEAVAIMNDRKITSLFVVDPETKGPARRVVAYPRLPARRSGLGGGRVGGRTFTHGSVLQGGAAIGGHPDAVHRVPAVAQYRNQRDSALHAAGHRQTVGRSGCDPTELPAAPRAKVKRFRSKQSGRRREPKAQSLQRRNFAAVWTFRMVV